MAEKLRPTWGYKAGEAQIFQLREGEDLPAGWADSPAKVGAAEVAPADPESAAEAMEGSVPPEWRTLHHSTRIKLAKSLAGELGELITNAKEADEFIEKHEADNG